MQSCEIISNFIHNTMKKKFILIAGRKFYCDEKGNLTKDAEGAPEEVPATDTVAEEVNLEEGTEEAAKALKAAVAILMTSSEKSLGESRVKATEAIGEFFESITKSAKKQIAQATASQEKASFDVEEVKAGLKSLYEGKTKNFSFNLQTKADLDYLAKATSESGSLTGDVILNERVPEIDRAPARQVFIEQIADVVTGMTSDALSYVEVVTVTGAPASTAELATIPEEAFAFQEFTAPLKKIAVYEKHSVEILQDGPQLIAAIKNMLIEDMNIVTDNELLNGSGSGAHLNGIFTQASVMDATAVGTKRVASANLYDVIRVTMTKIAVTGKGKFQANYVLLNPDDADQLDLTKDSTGNYVLPPFRSADGTTIKGARVIENTGITAGKFLVGDFRKMHIGTKGGVEIEFTDADGTDFIKDILTIKMRRRIAMYVRSNDIGAFWAGTIATVKAALIAA